MKKISLLATLLLLLLSCTACDTTEIDDTATPATAPASQTASEPASSETSSAPTSSAPAVSSSAPASSSATSAPSSAAVAPVSYAEVAAVELDSEPVVVLTVGETSQIRAAAVPNNIDPANKVLAYTSDNTAIATVTKGGLVAYVADGTAKVTAMSNNGKSIVVTITCKSSKTTAPTETVPSKPIVSEAPAISTPKKNKEPFIEEEMLELDTTQDFRIFDAGVGIPMKAYYDGSQSWNKICSEITLTTSAYGYTVNESGFINSGTSTSGGYTGIYKDERDRYAIILSAWRTSKTDSGINDSINSALVVMKYFLGDENGKTLWKFVDYTQTNQLNVLEAKELLGITDIESSESSKLGDFVFEDGTTISYDYSDVSRQIIFYLT